MSTSYTVECAWLQKMNKLQQCKSRSSFSLLQKQLTMQPYTRASSVQYVESCKDTFVYRLVSFKNTHYHTNFGSMLRSLRLELSHISISSLELYRNLRSFIDMSIKNMSFPHNSKLPSSLHMQETPAITIISDNSMTQKCLTLLELH